jgi:hypothetical protein
LSVPTTAFMLFTSERMQATGGHTPMDSWPDRDRNRDLLVLRRKPTFDCKGVLGALDD